MPPLHFVIIWYYSFWQLNCASTTRGMVCTEWHACKSMQERLLIQDRPERAGWSKSDTTVTVFSSSPEGSGKTRLWRKARIVRRVKSAIHHIIQYLIIHLLSEVPCACHGRLDKDAWKPNNCCPNGHAKLSPYRTKHTTFPGACDHVQPQLIILTKDVGLRLPKQANTLGHRIDWMCCTVPNHWCSRSSKWGGTVGRGTKNAWITESFICMHFWDISRCNQCEIHIRPLRMLNHWKHFSISVSKDLKGIQRLHFLHKLPKWSDSLQLGSRHCQRRKCNVDGLAVTTAVWYIPVSIQRTKSMNRIQVTKTRPMTAECLSSTSRLTIPQHSTATAYNSPTACVFYFSEIY